MVCLAQHVLEWNQLDALGQQFVGHAVHLKEILQILTQPINCSIYHSGHE